MFMQQQGRFTFQVGVVVLLAVLTNTANSGSGSGLLFLGLIVATFIYLKNQRTPYEVQTQTTLSSEDAIRTAVQTFTLAGWQVTSQTPDNATFTINKKGSCLIAFFLLLLGFIPGILYLSFSGRSISANVYAQATGGATTTVRVSGNAQGFGGREPTDRVIRALSSAPVGTPRRALP